MKVRRCRLRQLLSRSSTFLPPSLEGGLDCPHCGRPTFPLEGGLDGLPLRVFNEGLLRPRVARAQETV